jgi:UDP-N-acetylmuramate dehydrogenase
MIFGVTDSIPFPGYTVRRVNQLIDNLGCHNLALAVQDSTAGSKFTSLGEREAKVLGRIVGAVRFKEPLSFHTSLRIGGPAEFFVVPQDLDDIRYAMAFAEQEQLPVVVIGGGNNILVSDRGVQAVILKLHGILGRAEFHGEEVAVGGGVSLSGLIREAAALDLGGLEPLAGIPATIGGALATNAGTDEASLIDLCSAVYYLHPDGTLGEFRPLGYAVARTFDLPPGAVVVGCRMRLVRRPAKLIHKDLQQRLRVKKSSQPVALASAGYVWRNPPAQLAERLIGAVGLRGKRVNGAEISAKCGNFIVNRGGATHRDVLDLLDMTRERVEARFGITLRTEIRMLSFDPVGSETEPLELTAAR